MSKTKDVLLGEPHGTAAAKLRKQLLFKYVQLAGHDVCHRCSRRIERVEDLSIEHKTAWQRAADPKATFFDLSDIAFSHLRCNCSAATPWNAKGRTPEEQLADKRRIRRESKKRRYSPEKRRQDYLERGW